MRTTAVLSTIVLSGALLAGCGNGGGSSSSGYCSDLKDAKSQFSSLNSGAPDFDKFNAAIETFHDLADEAPSAVEDDWKTLDDALTKLQSDLKSVGLSVEDLGAITQGSLPEGMTQEELTKALPKLQAAFASLSASDVEASAHAIEKHAKSECGVNLNGS